MVASHIASQILSVTIYFADSILPSPLIGTVTLSSEDSSPFLGLVTLQIEPVLPTHSKTSMLFSEDLK